MKIGILLVMGGAAVTSTSVVLAGRFLPRKDAGFTESEKRVQPLYLFPKWVVVLGFVGAAVFFLGVVLTLGNLA